MTRSLSQGVSARAGPTFARLEQSRKPPIGTEYNPRRGAPFAATGLRIRLPPSYPRKNAPRVHRHPWRDVARMGRESRRAQPRLEGAQAGIPDSPRWMVVFRE